MSLRLWIKRYWRSKGFGIHSPFAYMLITEIVHCPYSYYAYGEITDASREQFTREVYHDAKLLHRISARFRITKAVLPTYADKMLTIALQRANSKIEITDKIEGDNNQIIYITSQNENLYADLEKISECDMVFVIVRGIKEERFRKLFKQFIEQMSRGVVLEDSDLATVVVNRKMPMMHYDVRL